MRPQVFVTENITKTAAFSTKTTFPLQMLGRSGLFLTYSEGLNLPPTQHVNKTRSTAH